MPPSGKEIEMTREDIFTYADKCGWESAFNVALLAGADAFNLSWDDYIAFLVELDERAKEQEVRK